MNGGGPYGLFHLQAGGCGGCGLEVETVFLGGGLERLGLHLVGSPRHADLLLVSGVVTRALRPAVEAAWAAMAAPKYLIAAGDCALHGGMFRDSYAVGGGIGDLPVSLMIPGCPPPPETILEGLEMLLDALGRAAGATAGGSVGDGAPKRAGEGGGAPPETVPPPPPTPAEPPRLPGAPVAPPGVAVMPALPAPERPDPPAASPAPSPQARLPAAPRHRLGGGDSSGG